MIITLKDISSSIPFAVPISCVTKDTDIGLVMLPDRLSRTMHRGKDALIPSVTVTVASGFPNTATEG